MSEDNNKKARIIEEILNITDERRIANGAYSVMNKNIKMKIRRVKIVQMWIECDEMNWIIKE